MYFTIIIPTRNRINELALCLKRIKEQTFTDYEVLIIDDGSEYQISELYSEVIPADKKIKVTEHLLSHAKNT